LAKEKKRETKKRGNGETEKRRNEEEKEPGLCSINTSPKALKTCPKGTSLLVIYNFHNC
jgi:hypothetical protein